jgi:hypothetical protein
VVLLEKNIILLEIKKIIQFSQQMDFLQHFEQLGRKRPQAAKVYCCEDLIATDEEKDVDPINAEWEKEVHAQVHDEEEKEDKKIFPRATIFPSGAAQATFLDPREKPILYLWLLPKRAHRDAVYEAIRQGKLSLGQVNGVLAEPQFDLWIPTLWCAFGEKN